jgi:hypothetical protein
MVTGKAADQQKKKATFKEECSSSSCDGVTSIEQKEEAKKTVLS